MADNLEERLRSHARAFEGLMSLIPAERYYEKDNTDEWRKKKQTPEERKAARMAKLNPDNHKSAMDVMDDNERKRKREIEAEAKQDQVDGSVLEERPGEGLKQAKPKRVKTDESAKSASAPALKAVKSSAKVQTQPSTSDKSDDQRAAEKALKKKEKEEAKKEKIARKEEKRAAKKAAKKAAVETQADQDGSDQDADEQTADISMTNADDLDAVDVSGLADPEAPARISSPSPSPERESIFSAQQSASSTSSLDTSVPSEATKKRLQIPEVDKAALQARLQARIEALRAARKADGPDGRPAKNRAELIEARRKKAEQRKQSKKDQRALAKDDEVRQKAETELARLRGSGSPLGSDIFSPSIPRSPDTSFNFGRVAFQDGQQLDSNLSYFTHKPSKGPSDAKTAFLAAKNKQSRLSGLDEDKRNDIAEKDMWLNAKKKAHGERVRDDASLLKKTLKRTEKLKKKSEKEWNGRIEGVEKGIAAREKKRDDNLRKRREGKGAKGKGKKVASAGGSSKKRPGFEGGFRSKPGK